MVLYSSTRASDKLLLSGTGGATLDNCHLESATGVCCASAVIAVSAIPLQLSRFSWLSSCKVLFEQTGNAGRIIWLKGQIDFRPHPEISQTVPMAAS